MENKEFLLKSSVPVPFDLSFNAFCNYYKRSAKEWGTKAVWNSKIEELDLCNPNEGTSTNPIPLKSSDLIFAAFEAYRAKNGTIKELPQAPNNSIAYQKFVSGFFKALEELNIEPYMKRVLYSNSNIQYLKTNQIFLEPFIEKISLIISIVLQDQSSQRAYLLGNILNKLDEIIQDYLISNPLFEVKPENLSNVVNLEQTIKDICKKLRREDNEFSEIKDPKTQEIIKNYVDKFNEAQGSKNESAEKEKELARQAYIDYLNKNIEIDKQNNVDNFRNALFSIKKGIDKDAYKKEFLGILNFPYNSKTTVNYILQLGECDLPCDLTDVISQVVWEHDRLLSLMLTKGTNIYYRKYCSEIECEFINWVNAFIFNFENMQYVIQKLFLSPQSLSRKEIMGEILVFHMYVCTRNQLIQKSGIKVYWDMSKPLNITQYISNIKEVFPVLNECNYENYSTIYQITNNIARLFHGIFQKDSISKDVFFKDVTNPLFPISFTKAMLLDSLVILKQISELLSHKFIQKIEQQERISIEKINEIKSTSDSYSKISQGLNDAIYEFLYRAYNPKK